ncbi:hypothetical protein A1O1_04912 [Capronia coronata CBS 617.96]|uniref:Uncharacterized protein n=1 Tax=Capronia coronata CBS 617.96 TaxID=1182541 RepID=W9YEA0_9EURO|nr:uncharacterized protein A1O1_04912 [Capronia coronata CBS 617.96]EXJ87985.1 hypothetical protein A1O1_04912 [Capronia coronata CBS 617.96]
MTWAPWHVLHNWSPFKIDALGLVTLLGSEEVNSAVGRLVRSTYLEYLPLLGAFVIAGDRFTEKAAGFNLYNISQGIHTTDLSAWLTRWISSQHFEVTRSFVVWKVTPPRSRRHDISVAMTISFILVGFLVALAILSRDWYGFANATAMIVSILVRAYVIGQHRIAIDAMVHEVVLKSNPAPTAGLYEGERSNHKFLKANKTTVRTRNQASATVVPGGDAPEQSVSSLNGSIMNKASPRQVQITQQGQTGSEEMTKPDPKRSELKNSSLFGKPTKVLIIQPDSKAVTFWMPDELLHPPSLFIEGPLLQHPRTYLYVRSIGWLAFGVHIVTIGMADLASQLYTVVLLVLPTVLLVLKFGCDDSNWRSTIDVWRGRSVDRVRHHKIDESNEVDENANSGDFVKQRECWIGSRLKAEIYDWPASYEFIEEGEGEDKKWFNRVPKGKQRSRKRQDLYAWLALTGDEEESMDKWDLFPHSRNGNQEWWKTYSLKRDALRCNANFGPQRLVVTHYDLDERQKGLSLDAIGQAQREPHLRKLAALQVTTTAFPASSHHWVPVFGLEDTGLGDVSPQMIPDNEARPVYDGNTVSGSVLSNSQSDASTPLMKD